MKLAKKEDGSLDEERRFWFRLVVKYTLTASVGFMLLAYQSLASGQIDTALGLQIFDPFRTAFLLIGGGVLGLMAVLNWQGLFMTFLPDCLFFLADDEAWGLYGLIVVICLGCGLWTFGQGVLMIDPEALVRYLSEPISNN